MSDQREDGALICCDGEGVKIPGTAERNSSSMKGIAGCGLMQPHERLAGPRRFPTVIGVRKPGDGRQLTI